MTPRERLLAALRRQTPDRTPWSLALTPPVLAAFRAQTGAGDYRAYCAPSHDVEPEVPWENLTAFVDACREAP